MAYVKSSKIKMFPSSWRRKEYNPEANLNTEENLTNISRRVSAKSYDSYVVNKDGNEITFVIHGYWFKADLSDVIVSGQPLYAKIKLVNSVPDGNTDFNNLTLVPTNASVPGQLDDNLEIPENPDNDTNEFHGVEFYNSPLSTPWPEGVFELQLLDEEGKVPAKSYLNISTEQIQNGAESSVPISDTFNTNSIYVGMLSATSVYASSIVSTPLLSATNVSVTDRITTSGIYGNYAAFNEGGIYSLNTTYIAPLSANGITVVGSDYFNIGSTNSFYANTNYISLYAMTSISFSASGRIDISAPYLSLNCRYNMSLYGGNSVDVDTPSLNVGHITSANASGTIVLGSTATLMYASYPAYIGKNNTLSIINFASGGEIDTRASMAVNLEAPYVNLSATSGVAVTAGVIKLLASASKTQLTADTVGHTKSPIYLDNGVPKQCSFSADGGTKYLEQTYSTSDVAAIAGVSISDVTTANWNVDCSGTRFWITWIKNNNIIDINIRTDAALAGSGIADSGLRLKRDWLIKQCLGNSWSAAADGNYDTCVAQDIRKDVRGSHNHFVHYIDNNYIYIVAGEGPGPDYLNSKGLFIHISMRVA